MKIILNEKQYNNLILSKEWFNENISTKPKKIIITENQFSKLIKEQTSDTNLEAIKACYKDSRGKTSCGPKNVTPATKDGWSTRNGKWNAKNSYGDFRVGGDLVNVRYFCGWYNRKCYGCQPNENWGYNLHDHPGSFTGQGKFPNDKMRKWVEMIWELGYNKVGQGHNWKTDAARCYNVGIEEYIKLIQEGKIGRTYTEKGSDLEGDSIKTWEPKHWNRVMPGLMQLQRALYPSGTGRGSFPRMCGKGGYKTDWGLVGDFFNWVGEWNAQDWIDAAATVAFAISLVFPPAALVGVGLEAVNVGISGYKLATGEGSWGDLGLRVLFLFGGPLIGRGIGYGLKFGAKVASELFEIAVETFSKAAKVGAKEGSEAAAKEMTEIILSKGLSKGETEVVEQWIAYMKNNPKQFKESMEQMEQLTQRAAKGDKAAIETLEKMMKEADNVAPKKPSLNPMSKVKDKVIKIGNKEFKVNAYWEEFWNPFGKGLGAKIGVGLLSTLFIAFKGLEYKMWLLQQKLTPDQQEEVVKFVLDLPNVSKKVDKIYDDIGLSKDETPLHEALLEYSTKVSPETFKKDFEGIQDSLKSGFEEVQNLYKDGTKKINSAKAKKDKLFNLYNSFCEKIPGFENVNVLDPVTIKIDRTPQQRKQLNNVIKRQGVPFKNYKFVFDHKYKGLYEKRGGEWVNIISNCNISTKVLKDFCKSGDAKALTFCNNLNMTNHTLKTYNDVFIDYLEKEKVINLNKFEDYIESTTPEGW